MKHTHAHAHARAHTHTHTHTHLSKIDNISKIVSKNNML